MTPLCTFKLRLCIQKLGENYAFPSQDIVWGQVKVIARNSRLTSLRVGLVLRPKCNNRNLT